MMPCVAGRPPALTAGSKYDFQVRDLCLRSPETGDFWYRSRKLKKMICPPSEDSAHAGAIGLTLEPLAWYIRHKTDTVRLLRNAGVVLCMQSESLHLEIVEWFPASRNSLGSRWIPDVHAVFSCMQGNLAHKKTPISLGSS